MIHFNVRIQFQEFIMNVILYTWARVIYANSMRPTEVNLQPHGLPTSPTNRGTVFIVRQGLYAILGKK